MVETGNYYIEHHSNNRIHQYCFIEKNKKKIKWQCRPNVVLISNQYLISFAQRSSIRHHYMRRQNIIQPTK